MPVRRVIALITVLLLLVPLRAVAAVDDDDEGLELPATDIDPPAGPVIAQNTDLDFVRRRGVDLYERHQASLIALDAAEEVGLEHAEAEGWITVREGGAMQVRFVGSCPEGPCAVVDVAIDEEGLSAQAVFPPAPLPPEQRLAWQAKLAVFETQTATCEVPYNAVAIPPSDTSGEWVVYLVAQPQEPGVIAVGGHMRIYLDPTVTEVLRAEDFSAACVLARRAEGQDQIAINYPYGELPAETHVLTSLLHRLVLFVGAASGVYRVNGDGIERLADRRPVR